jgi:hypothetical protein
LPAARQRRRQRRSPRPLERRRAADQFQRAHALGHIALVERRQRTIIEHIRPPAVELNSTNENRRRSEIREDIGTKIDDALAADRRRRLLQPGDPHEEANLRLQEEEWNETHPQKRAMDMYWRFGRSLHDRSR